MNIYHYKSETGNVGDDLNVHLWPQVIGKIELPRPDDDEILVGIGTVLDDRFDRYKRKIVAGAGARSFESAPRLDSTWEIIFVRGPLTAQALGLPNSVAITDPAYLAAHYLPRPTISEPHKIGIVPYFSGVTNSWHKIAKRLDADLISPHLPYEDFINLLSRCRVVLTESLHGAVFSDMLGIPWIPITGVNFLYERETHYFKWIDFCSSIKTAFNPVVLDGSLLLPTPGLRNIIRGTLGVKLCCNRLKLRLLHGPAYLSNRGLLMELVERMLERMERLQVLKGGAHKA